MEGYFRPQSLDEALELLASAPATVLAGGTDFFPARVGPRAPEPVLDISALRDLRGLEATDDGWRFGALTTWTDIIEADLPPLFDGLKLAAREVGGAQIQNRGTLAGNLCNASPAADGVPPLLALDATVELSARGGRTELPLARFIQGNRKTCRRPEQLVTAVRVPARPGLSRSTFLKLGARKYLVISIVMVAVTLEQATDGTVAEAAVAVGSCSAVAQRLRVLESDLIGRPIRPGLGALVTPRHIEGLAPIDDVRGSADYRKDTAVTLIARALDRVATEWAATERTE